MWTNKFKPFLLLGATLAIPTFIYFLLLKVSSFDYAVKHALSALTILSTASIVVWQVGEQKKSSLELQKEESREKIKLEIYRNLIKKVNKTSGYCSKAVSLTLVAGQAITRYQQSLKNEIHPTSLGYRIDDFINIHKLISEGIVNIIREFESWTIVFPNIKVFQAAISSSNHDLMMHYSNLFPLLIKALPKEPPKELISQNLPTFPPEKLSNNELESLQVLLIKYQESANDIQSYLYDLTCEGQNMLLSGLFKNHVKQREPIDPKHKVITTDSESMKKLILFFENETAWGKANKKAEEDVRKLHLRKTNTVKE